MMNKYESVIIVNPNLEEESVKNLIKKYKFKKDDNIKFDLKKIINEAGVKVE